MAPKNIKVWYMDMKTVIAMVLTTSLDFSHTFDEVNKFPNPKQNSPTFPTL